MNTGIKKFFRFNNLSITLILTIFLFSLLFFVSKPAYAGNYKESYRILKQAYGENVTCGHKMKKDDVKYQLLSMKVKENFPFLAEVIKSTDKPRFRTRAFYTLAMMAPEEHRETIKNALNDKKLDRGELLILLAKANKREYKDLILEKSGELMEKEPYSITTAKAVEALAVMGGREAKEKLRAYFQKALDDAELTNTELKMWAVNDALYNCRDFMKYENVCRNLLRKLMAVDNTFISVPAACTLYDYGRENESRKFFKLNGEKLKEKAGFDMFDYYVKVYQRMDKDLGNFLIKNAVKNGEISPDLKIKLLKVLAKQHDSDAQEWLKDMYRNKEKNFEEALWLLAAYYNDKWIRDKVTELYKDDIYWTPAGAKRRAFLAKAYLVMSDKRSVGFFKKMLSDVNQLKKAYACEGLRFQNARGTKPELISLIRNMDFHNPFHQMIGFQCSRVLFRFGKRHFIVQILKSNKIPMKRKQLGLASIGDTGDKEDLELLKHIQEEISPDLYDSYMYALVRIARQETFPLVAETRGVRDEPLRDSRLLMKKILEDSDVKFRRKAAGYIEFFVYHWQSVTLLKDCVQSDDSEVKIQGILSFRNAKDSTTIGKAKSAMKRCFTDPDFKVKAATAYVYSILENRQKNYE